MTELQDHIISVFLDRETDVLKDTDISNALVNQGIPCYITDIQRNLQLLSPGLFHITLNRDGTQEIRVAPTIEVCQEFLNGNCTAESGTCPKLHICRQFERGCTTLNCRFSHDFTRGINRKIVVQNNCLHINPKLLVKLLRRRRFSNIPSFPRAPNTRGNRGGRGENRRTRGRRHGRGGAFANHASSSNFVLPKHDPNLQVDVSFPLSNDAQQIDTEVIEMLLNLHDIKVENKLDDNKNEYFHRATIQLKQISDVDKLLSSPIITHHGVDIKFKRTNQLIDKSSFIFRTTINNGQEKIPQARVNLYLETLMGKDIVNQTPDLSSDSEQIILIQCKREIDFDKIRQAQASRPQLSNRQITLTQIYECDALELRYNDENQFITKDDLKKIFSSVWKDIFAFNFRTHNYADVEFINADALKRWMSTSQHIEDKFGLLICPIIDNVDEDSDTKSVNSIQTAASDVNIRLTTTTTSVFEEKPAQTTIKLGPDWEMVANHSKFKVEYKEFIHDNFGGEVDVQGDKVTYTGTFPRNVPGSSNEVILGNKTNEFMKKFSFQKFWKLDQNQIDILLRKSTTVAFQRDKAKDYLVATKSQEMQELRNLVFAKTNQRRQFEQPHPLMGPRLNQRPPSITSPDSVKTESRPTMASGNDITLTYSVSELKQMSMFSINKFEERLREYLHENFNVQTEIERNVVNEKAKGAKASIRIKVSGQLNHVQDAINDLSSLFSSINTKTFDDKTDGSWTKIDEATHVIQHHFQLANLICSCEKTTTTTITVHFFHITNPQFGVDEQQIEDLIRDTFQCATINLNSEAISSKLTKDWTDLENRIRKQNDYRTNICISKESNTIYVFGLPALVKDVRQQFEQLKNKYELQPFKMTLSDRQLNYLAQVAKADMNKLEKQFKSDACDISLARLRREGDFLAPIDLHTKIKDSIEALVQVRDITFEINEPGFDVFINKDFDRLIAIVKSKCLLEKNIDIHRIHIPIPKARMEDVADGVQQNQSASATTSAKSNTKSVTVGHSTLTVAMGSLTTQAVDAIVACTSSEYLCKTILDKAGPQVVQEYGLLRSSKQFPNATSGGTLSCKQILFIPWSSDSHSEADIKSSMNTFIGTAFALASSGGLKSIAFPAVGCGKLNFDPLVIAKHMLQETRDQLKTQKTKMDISFVLVPEQPNIYDAFIQRLNELEAIDLKVSSKPPSTTRKNDQSTIVYDEKIVKLTLISSNDNHLIKCKQEIITLAQSVSYKSQLTDKQDVLDWSQNTIYKYYEFCLKQRVIPTLDLDNTSLQLDGTRDAVHEAEKYFYELTSETLRQARIHAVSRGVIWSVEPIPQSGTWEQYSFKLNGTIEDAYQKLSHVDFVNDKAEKCRVNFSTMEEQHEGTTRRVRRNLVDSTLPSIWEPSNENCKRVLLQASSPEYQKVFAQFHLTMLGKYTQIVKIERIQNERWYKQYDAHREDFKRRYSQIDERLLFHGCPSTSADQIIRECFNRSFAGINGVVYGCGVYFHVQASYSHQYAHANNTTGERTMFLARVLVGQTCKGDPKMKVAPAGHDTTTDGQYIFVVYHDAGAYGDHLITYK